MPRFLLIALVLGLLGSCGSDQDAANAGAASASRLSIHASDGVVRFDVEVADDEEERATGLMNRERLEPFDGMAFVWDKPIRASFWMKDTLIPLSIAFWNEAGRIVAILDMEPCRQDPCPTYDPGTAFVGALEVDRGRFTEEGVEVGDRVELEVASG